jgi:type II secretory pathway pseudopilin PulG
MNTVRATNSGDPGKNQGFTLVEIMIIVSCISLLAAIAIPNFLKSRDRSQLNSIYNNLRIIDNAKDQWALENKKGEGNATDLVAIADYIKGATVKTVVGETYACNPVGSPAVATTNVKLGTYAPLDPITAP